MNTLGVGGTWRRRKRNRRESTGSRNRWSRQLFVERLEGRQLLATLSQIGGASTLQVDLDQQDEALQISKTGDTITLTSTQNFTGQNLPANLNGLNTKTVSYDQTQLYWSGMEISDSAANCSVTFNSSNKQFAGDIKITLDDANAGAITFAGSTNVQQDLFAQTNGGAIAQTGGMLSVNKTITLQPATANTLASTVSYTFNSLTDFGKIVSNGSLNLTGSSFSPTFNFTPDPGDIFQIIEVADPADQITGTFLGFDEKEVFYWNSEKYFITYTGGDGNDVELIRIHECLAAGSGEGTAAHVRVYEQGAQVAQLDLHPYADSFLGGVRVGTGDVNGDGWEDVVTVPGRGMGPEVVVFSGQDGTELRRFFAYDAAFMGGITVAVADVNGDHLADIITGAGPGAGPHIKVFDGTGVPAPLFSFYAFAPEFYGGITVAADDFNANGRSDLIVGAGPGAGPHVKVFDGSNPQTELKSFYAFDAGFRGGVSVAAGDLNTDGYTDLLVGAGPGASPHVITFDGDPQFANRVLHSFFCYDTSFRGGVFVATDDRDGDGWDDIITGPGAGGEPLIRCFTGQPNLHNLEPPLIEDFLVFADQFRGELYVGPT